MKSFHHSGDLGDIVYSLPTVRALGGGDLYLTPAIKTREWMTPCRAAAIVPLLAAQPYIDHATYADEPPCGAIDLNTFRRHLRWMRNGRHNLAEAHLHTFSLPLDAWHEPWLSVEPLYVADTIIARSARYHRPRMDWGGILQQHPEAVFVGMEKEHEAFVAAYGPIPRRPTADLLQLARIIAGAKLFIGNQSCPLAIANGLGTPVITEEYERDPNCRFPRPIAGGASAPIF